MGNVRVTAIDGGQALEKFQNRIDLRAYAAQMAGGLGISSYIRGTAFFPAASSHSRQPSGVVWIILAL
jgi:hypothetical protein